MCLEAGCVKGLQKLVCIGAGLIMVFLNLIQSWKLNHIKHTKNCFYINFPSCQRKILFEIWRAYNLWGPFTKQAPPLFQQLRICLKIFFLFAPYKPSRFCFPMTNVTTQIQKSQQECKRGQEVPSNSDTCKTHHFLPLITVLAHTVVLVKSLFGS